MLENEVDYRLAKMLLGCLYHDGLLTEKQMQKVWQNLKTAIKFPGILSIRQMERRFFRLED